MGSSDVRLDVHLHGSGASGREHSGFPRPLFSAARRRPGTTLAICLPVLVALWLLLGAGSALAAPSVDSSFVYSHSFADEGQIGSSGGTTGIAVEPGSGNVLVADVFNGVKVFAPGSGQSDPPLTTFYAGASGFIAIDQASGAIYLLDQYGGTLTRWTSDGAPVPTYTQDMGFAPQLPEYNGGIAVDPTTGDLLVAVQSTHEIVRFDSSGARVSSFDVPPDPLAFSFPYGVAVGPDGKVYVVDEFAPRDVVTVFTPAGEDLGRLPVPGKAQSVTFDPVLGAIVVVAERTPGVLWIEAYDPAGERILEVPYPESLGERHVRGVAVDSETGRLYVLSGGIGEDAGVQVFESVQGTGAEAPHVSAISTTSVHLSAEVEPGAGPPAGSFAYFEYSGDGGETWTATATQELTGAGTVEADLTGLEPNFDYLVRLVVGNETSRHMTISTPFTTLPVAPITATGKATDVSETSAVINGTINPAGLQTTYHFEYGLTDAYGSRTPAAIEAVAGNGHAPRIFSRTLRGLEPGTTYHYRLVAESSQGVSEGEDRTFTTLTPGAIPARAYEQVTPVDKLGATVDSKYGMQAAPDGSAISYVTRNPVGVNSSPQFARFMSYRGSEDWQAGLPTDPPLNTARSTVFTTTIAISDDFAHAFVVSNRDLLGDGVENGANLYRQDLRTGEYTLIAGTAGAGAFNLFTSLQTQNEFMWGNADYSEVVFLSQVPLMSGVSSAALYRWSDGGGLELESVLPGGTMLSGETVLPSASGDSRYVSEDGRRAYFTITEGSDAGVYLSEDGQTRAISVSRRTGDPATPQPGLFLAAGNDGRYGYFFTYTAQLTDDAPEKQGDIYRYDAAEDKLEYIGSQAGPGLGPSNVAALGTSDDGETFYFAGPGGIEVFREGTVRLVAPSDTGLGGGFVSPSGRYLGYGEELSQAVFLYDAVTEEVTCASCLSDGSNPRGAFLPLAERSASNQIPDAVTESGELFFDTSSRLVAADVNGEYDVYVFEDGKVRLISPGDAPFPAHYGDISADGRDVFFTTAQGLVGRDSDQSIDIYDARIGGGLPKQSPPPPKVCLRDDCKATPNAGPELPFGGSEAIDGSANVKPKKPHKRCGKGRHLRKVKGKKRCVPKHKKADHKQANSNRRQAR
jgi:DNA-binding beta-propeller fold protein YncE